MARKQKLSEKQVRTSKLIQQDRIDRLKRKAALAEEEISAGGLGPEQEGLVITNFGATLDIEDDKGNIHRCAFRQNMDTLVSGDRVVWQQAEDERGVVTATIPRQSLLSRPDFTGQMKPIAANIDQIIIIVSPVPELKERLIDRYLVAAENINVAPVIMLNKIDLLESKSALEEVEERLEVYANIGYRVIYTSTKRENGLDALFKTLEGKTSILVGQSGVGKSSLINRLLPYVDAKTQAVSEATGKGQHTTSAARLYHLFGDGKLIDSPGVREFGLWNVDRDQVAHGFREFRDYLGSCKFKDCTHSHEPGCAIQQAIENGKIEAKRLGSYHRIIETLGT